TAPAMSAIWSRSPRNDAKPVRPLNRPAPDNRPNRPAPSKPPSSNPPNPPPKREAAGAVAGVPATFLVPGWVIDRSMGDAGLGAVFVAGGVLKVRLPRLPPLLTRASAASIMNTNIAASARESTPSRDVNMGASSFRRTDAPLYGDAGKNCHAIVHAA